MCFSYSYLLLYKKNKTELSSDAIAEVLQVINRFGLLIEEEMYRYHSVLLFVISEKLTKEELSLHIGGFVSFLQVNLLTHLKALPVLNRDRH